MIVRLCILAFLLCHLLAAAGKEEEMVGEEQGEEEEEEFMKTLPFAATEEVLRIWHKQNEKKRLVEERKEKIPGLKVAEADLKAQGYAVLTNIEGINDQDEEHGMSALMTASLSGKVNEIASLMLGGAEIDLANKRGDTPLLIAAQKGLHATVLELLKFSPNMHLLNTLQANALHVAVAENFYIIVLALLMEDKDRRSNPEKYPSVKQQVPLVDSVMMRGRLTPIMLACQEGHLEILKLLLEHKPNVNAVNDKGETALMIASITNQPLAVSELLTVGGAHTNITNHGGFTALMLASSRGHVKVIKLLLEHDPDGLCLNIKDSIGFNALNLAMLNRQAAAVDLLIAAGIEWPEAGVSVSSSVMQQRRSTMEERRRRQEEALDPSLLKKRLQAEALEQEEEQIEEEQREEEEETHG